MLVSELKKVIDIDSRITSLHEELAALYSERQKYINQNGAAITRKGPKSSKMAFQRQATTKDNTVIEHTYNYLQNTWKQYGISIPSLRTLKKGLVASHVVMADLSEKEPELYGKLGIFLVPPTQILGQPYDTKYRKQQTFISLDDHLNASLLKRYYQKKWRLFVVYDEEVPLNLGKAKDILTEKKFMFGNYDARGLGVYEYYALSLSISKPIDQHTWTLLLKGSGALSNTVTSVTFINGQYRFEVDDADGVFGDERFRPAVEIAVL